MPLRPLLLFVAIESFVIVLMERGVYFFTDEVLGYSAAANLWLALCFGLLYVVGAQGSHRLCRRVGERRVLLACLFGQMGLHAVVMLFPQGLALWAGMLGIGLLGGLKWPVLESYVSAGRAPREQARALGSFNLAWSIPVPLALVATGNLIAWHPVSLFALAMLLNLSCLLLLPAFPPKPQHLSEHEHGAKPRPPHWRSLLRASRWNMLAGYVMLFLLAPLLPGIFRRLDVPVATATMLAACLDGFRALAFLVCRQWTGWHGRLWTLPLGWFGLPLGLALCLLGSSTALVVTGEAIFGLAAGLTYYAAIYYAMHLDNASVEAGGDHEGLIGAGFALGPGLGLLGLSAAGFPGILVGGLCLSALATWAGLRTLRHPQPSSQGTP